MTTVSTERLARVFAELSDTLVEDFDVVDYLLTVTRRTAELVGNADVGLLLADQRGQLQFMAGSTEDVARLELFQVQVQEGPCLDAFQTGRPVVNAALDTAANRWPQFAPRAAAAGYRAVHAFPLRLRDEVIGAIGVFHSDASSWGPADVDIAQSLAHVATIGLLQERSLRRGAVLTEQLQSALNSRVVLEQAKGAVAERHGVTVDEAFQLLRSHARSTRTHLVDVAHAALADPAGLSFALDETGPSGSGRTTRGDRLDRLLVRSDHRDRDAERRDRAASTQSDAEAGPLAWREREHAARDRDAAAADRSDIVDLFTGKEDRDEGQAPDDPNA